jgi:formylmethanofuran dehydrogenase subunit C
MSALRLTLIARPPQRVDLGRLTAEPLAGRTAAEIAALPLVLGTRRVRLDELFRVSGTPGAVLEIAGGDDRLDRIGAGLAGGRIVVEGNAGAYLGQRMTGGSITVSGHTGVFAASGMKGGDIRVAGDAGDFLAAAIPGDHQGMQGGLVLVGGNAGDRAGDRMRRGALIINGNAGDCCASRMVAGTIAVGGTVGRSTGMAMRRGTVLLRATPTGLPVTFNDCGRFPLTILSLLARAWRGLPGPFGALPDGGLTVRRFMGDVANDGKGEILVQE